MAGTVPPSQPAVAIVGSRRPTQHGLAWAAELAAGLARRGIPVVSGMALGIDAAAHEGALMAGGTTIAVLGCGIEVHYPRQNERLRRRILECGCLLSEEPPDTPPAPWLFPKRNRLIAALSLVVVVVEAAERSGSLITAGHALDLSREVFVCPANRGRHSVGSNRLLRDGASIVTELDDLFAASPRLGEAAARHAARTASAPSGGGPSRAAGRLSARILEQLLAGPLHADDLVAALGVDVRSVAVELTRLELAGLATRRPGGLVAATVGGADAPARAPRNGPDAAV